MSVRRLLESLGLIDPDDAEMRAAQAQVRMKAEAVNAAARREIEESRARRAVLRLRLEQIRKTR